MVDFHFTIEKNPVLVFYGIYGDGKTGDFMG